MMTTTSWQMVQSIAATPLRDAVYGYTGFTESAAVPVRRVEASRPRVKLLIAFNGEIGLGLPDQDGPLQSHRAFVTGLGTGPVIAAHDGVLSCIEVELNPWAVPRFFGDAPSLMRSAVDLSDLWGTEAEYLGEQLAAARDWSARFAAIDKALLARQAAAHCDVRGEVRWAWDRLERSGGRANIARLARECGWSDRHFIACFTNAIGEPPKRAARRFRFDRARRLIDASPLTCLSTVALDCGYSDQSHLTREFSTFAGCSPARYRDAHLRDLPGTSVEALVR